MEQRHLAGCSKERKGKRLPLPKVISILFKVTQHCLPFSKVFLYHVHVIVSCKGPYFHTVFDIGNEEETYLYSQTVLKANTFCFGALWKSQLLKPFTEVN